MSMSYLVLRCGTAIKVNHSTRPVRFEHRTHQPPKSVCLRSSVSGRAAFLHLREKPTGFKSPLSGLPPDLCLAWETSLSSRSSLESVSGPSAQDFPFPFTNGSSNQPSHSCC